MVCPKTFISLPVEHLRERTGIGSGKVSQGYLIESRISGTRSSFITLSSTWSVMDHGKDPPNGCGPANARSTGSKKSFGINCQTGFLFLVKPLGKCCLATNASRLWRRRGENPGSPFSAKASEMGWTFRINSLTGIRRPAKTSHSVLLSSTPGTPRGSICQRRKEP